MFAGDYFTKTETTDQKVSSAKKKRKMRRSFQILYFFTKQSQLVQKFKKSFTQNHSLSPFPSTLSFVSPHFTISTFFKTSGLISFDAVLSHITNYRLDEVHGGGHVGFDPGVTELVQVLAVHAGVHQDLATARCPVRVVRFVCVV